MKKFMTTLVFVLFASTAQADFFGGDNFGGFGGSGGEWKQGPYGPYWDESNWPEWTPMYWMEEFMDSWDDNDNGYYGGGYGMPFGGSGYGYPNMPYGGYGYGYPAMPYGGGYGYQMPPVPPIPAPVVPPAP